MSMASKTPFINPVISMPKDVFALLAEMKQQRYTTARQEYRESIKKHDYRNG